MQNEALMNESKYSEQFYAQDEDGKDYQIEIELEDGPNAEDPEKITVVLNGERKTVDVPKDGTDDHYKKAIAAGLKEHGKYKLMEGKIPEAAAIVPKFVQINTQGDFDKYIKPALGKGNGAYGLDDIKGMWWELSEEDKIPNSAKTMREIRDGIDKRPRIIFISGAGNERGITDMSFTEYAREMGMTTKDYLDGVKPFESEADEAAKKPLYAYIGYSGSWGEGDDEKVKLPAGDNYLDIVSKYFDTKPEEIDAKWRKKLEDCKTDEDFGKILAAMYDAMEAFVFALRRGSECVWSNPKGSKELNDKDWQGPDYDWLTEHV